MAILIGSVYSHMCVALPYGHTRVAQRKKYTGAASDFAPESALIAPVTKITRAKILEHTLKKKIALVVISDPMRDFSKPALPAFVNNEYQHSCSNLRREFRTLFYLRSIPTEKKCKTKTRTTAKLRNYPPQNSLKLPLPIVKKFHNLEIVLTYCVLKHCQYFQIENYMTL